MFTGIVEEVGMIERIAPGFPATRLVIRAKTVLEGAKIGDSICVDGVCLTVVAITKSSFSVDVQEETRKRTCFSRYRPGVHVNLERALTPTSRLGGHYVQGHVDDVAPVESWRQEGGDWVLRIRVPSALKKYIVEKGFVAVNGISLTVASRTGSVAIHIIPHTRAATSLQHLAPGDQVNIEVDIIAKYVESVMG